MKPLRGIGLVSVACGTSELVPFPKASPVAAFLKQKQIPRRPKTSRNDKIKKTQCRGPSWGTFALRRCRFLRMTVASFFSLRLAAGF
jgi:hypothetical protein